MYPEELKQLKQWVIIAPDSKVPMDALSRRYASTKDPKTWTTYDVANDFRTNENLGFVFDDNGIVGVDLDKGFDELGLPTEESLEIINKFKSYTELSRSGRGFHIFVKGKLPFDGRNNRKGVEAYQDGRYFIMTGETVIYDEIIENQEAIDWLVETHFAEESTYTPPSREKSLKRPSRGAISTKIYQPNWNPIFVNGKIRLRPDYPVIEEGGRNTSLLSLAGFLQNMDFSASELYNELLYANSVACVPPLSTAEIGRIVMNIEKYR